MQKCKHCGDERYVTKSKPTILIHTKK